eukprot:TRINITY_DN3454_c0_g1_i1.p1 TRINITY_DN3454_c0_g1~~TRINITY_DN3454_c0_g1_i1.p1  ORF type:complete len:213 (-),score=37.93 TRINITY_DN3454_c0_g1_i1:642-1244(-)
MAKYYGKLEVGKCALFVCDMQEKFAKSIQYFDEIAVNISRMVEGAKLLEIPLVVTEQYPQGLGNTVSSIGIYSHGIEPFVKTSFSMVTPEVSKHLKEKLPNVSTILLTGVETHVCVINTAIDLLELGYNVHVIVDCSSSRVLKDRIFAMDRFRQMGAYLNTTESVLLSLVKDKNHPQFKPIQKLIMEPGPDTGLTQMAKL